MRNPNWKGLKYETVNEVVNELAATKRITSEHIGVAGIVPNEWKLFENLRQIASEDELAVLTDHRSPAVRYYAFYALAGKCSPRTFPLLLSHLNDTTLVETQFGCSVFKDPVMNYFLDIVTPDKIDLGVYKLNASERNIVDSILRENYSKGIKLHAPI